MNELNEKTQLDFDKVIGACASTGTSTSITEALNRRPTKQNLKEYLVILVARDIQAELTRWYDSPISPDDLEEFLSDNAGWHNPDGYQLAKDFESDFCCEGDSELVNILDDVSCFFDSHLSRLEREWIKVNKITPKFSIGDVVIVPKCDRIRHKEMNGIIVHIYNDSGKYVVSIKELGHKDLGDKSPGVNGTILNFEYIEEHPENAKKIKEKASIVSDVQTSQNDGV